MNGWVNCRSNTEKNFRNIQHKSMNWSICWITLFPNTTIFCNNMIFSQNNNPKTSYMYNYKHNLLHYEQINITKYLVNQEILLKSKHVHLNALWWQSSHALVQRSTKITLNLQVNTLKYWYIHTLASNYMYVGYNQWLGKQNKKVVFKNKFTVNQNTKIAIIINLSSRD